MMELYVHEVTAQVSTEGRPTSCTVHAEAPGIQLYLTHSASTAPRVGDIILVSYEFVETER